MKALLGCCNPCNSEAHNSGATRIVMGPYLELLAAQAELRALLGGAGPSQGSGEGEEEEEEQEHAEAAEEPKPNECTRGPYPTSVKFQELHPKSS